MRLRGAEDWAVITGSLFARPECYPIPTARDFTSGISPGSRAADKGHHWRMTKSWTITELHEALEQFERAARSAGLAENSIDTYVGRSRIFVRWLDDEFEFKGGSGR